jgi:hypothetical protein
LDEFSSFLKLPDLEDAGYLVGLLSELGFVSSNGMGAQPVTWLEIDAWLRATQLDIPIWERLTLKEMSEVYASELSKASAKDAAAPYVPEDVHIAENRTAVADKIRNVFSSFKRKKTEEISEPQD